MSAPAPTNTLDRLTAVDFRLLGEWAHDGNTLDYHLTPKTPANEARLKGSSLYAFVCRDRVLYIGKASRSLKQRFVGYRKPSTDQSTNIKCHRGIKASLAKGEAVQIYALSGETQLRWGDFELNLAAGLEDSLINELAPLWNGRAGARAMTDSEMLERQALHLPVPVANPGPGHLPLIPTEAPEVDAVPANDKHVPFTVELGKTYYFKGFINVPVRVSAELGAHDEPLVFFLGRQDPLTVEAKIDRKANRTGAPRLYGGQKVARWFQNHFDEGDKVKATIVSANEVVLEDPEKALK